jgi:hypothetical protein
MFPTTVRNFGRLLLAGSFSSFQGSDQNASSKNSFSVSGEKHCGSDIRQVCTTSTSRVYRQDSTRSCLQRVIDILKKSDVPQETVDQVTQQAQQQQQLHDFFDGYVQSLAGC